jgi:SM-20-related protein
MDPAVRHDAMLAESLRERGFGVVEGFLAEATWRSLAREARRGHARGRFRRAGVGRGASFRVAPEIRNDAVLWIDPAAPTRAQRRWLARVERLRLALNQSLYLGLLDYEGHLARFAPGAHYRTHLDRFADASHRVVSLVLYLNDDWSEADGGALRLYLGAPDEAPWEDVVPRGGTVAAFLSGEIAHEVRPATRERFSLVGWLTTRSGATPAAGASATRRVP